MRRPFRAQPREETPAEANRRHVEDWKRRNMLEPRTGLEHPADEAPRWVPVTLSVRQADAQAAAEAEEQAALARRPPWWRRYLPHDWREPGER